MNILEVNLNLLVTFQALMTERNVTRAAARVGLSQPAMSNSLAQLRGIFGDPLLVRSPGGMTPTARALELEAPVARGLAELAVALQSQVPFDPATSQRTFVVGANDLMEMSLLPLLLQRLSRDAPGVNVVVQPWLALHSPPEALAQGEMDLVLGIFRKIGAGQRQQNLFLTRFVVMVRTGHPRVGARLSLDRYLELTHILVTTQKHGLGTVDEALARIGKTRRIGLRLPHFLIVPHIVAQTDMVVAISPHIAEPYCRLLPLRMVNPPLELPQDHMHMVWHERTHADPAQLWLRGMIAEIAAGL